MRVLINIITYNRPRHLAQLLADLQGQRARVHIHDDCSVADDYAPIRAYANAMPNVRYLRARRRYGKHEHWKMVNGVFEQIRYTPSVDLSIHLPDDVRLCENFVSRCVTLWQDHASLKPRPIAINLLRDHRDNCWTQTQLLNCGSVRRTGWVDGCFICSREYYERLGWQIPEPPAHMRAPHLGSGAYRTISQILEPHLYQAAKSLVVHVPGPSRMHPNLRAATPIETVDFVERPRTRAGAVSTGRLDGGAMRRSKPIVFAGMATIPERLSILPRVVASLVDQVDILGIYLNGHDAVPNISHPRIEWESSRLTSAGDLGDASKFYWAMIDQGLATVIHMTVDDDIIYPPDYVARLVKGVIDYPDAVVGIHGFRFHQPIASFYRSRHPRFHCTQGLPRDAQVHVLGTGTTAFRGGAINVWPGMFVRPNMADLWLALAAKRQGVRMMCLSRPAGWLEPLKPDGGTIHDDYLSAGDAFQTRMAVEAGPWPTLPPW